MRTYEIDQDATDRYVDMLRDNNQVRATKISGFANDLHGLRATFDIRSFCTPLDSWDYEVPLPDKVTYDHDRSPYAEELALLGDFDQAIFGSLDGEDKLGDL